jgi:hypothetical protein
LALIDVQGAEYGVHPLPIEVVGIGEVALRSQGVRLKTPTRRFGSRYGSGFDEYGIDEGENGHARTHAEPQHHDRGSGKSWRLAELAESEAEVALESVKHLFLEGLPTDSMSSRFRQRLTY